MKEKGIWKILVGTSIVFLFIGLINAFILYRAVTVEWQGDLQNLLGLDMSTALGIREWNGVTGVSTYGNFLGPSVVWLMISFIAMVVCLVMAIRIKHSN